MAAGDFCTVAQVKTLISVKPNTVTDEGLINMLITGVSREFRTVLSRDILRDAYDEVYDGLGTSMIMLVNTPVTDVTSVEAGPPGQRTALTLNIDYVWSQFGITRLCGRFPMTPAWVRVVYEAGYAAVPSDLALAAAKAVAYRYKQLDRLGQNSKSFGQEMVQFETTPYTQDVAAVLEAYKRRAPI